MTVASILDFFKAWFDASEAPACLTSLPNIKDDPNEPGERFILTREITEIEEFIAKWDRPGRALYYCVSTIRTKRNKDNVVEICGLHADIDFKDVVDDEKTILRRVKELPLPPSIIVRSGNGLHLYWPFKESIKVNIVDGVEEIERVEAALKLLCDLVGGDQKVTHIAALMRLPGSHNSKLNDDFKLAEVESIDNRKFELDDIEDEMLAITSPKVLRHKRPPEANDSNPFLDAAKLLGFKPPIDVQRRLEAMGYMAGGENAIHETQVAVTASLLNSGVSLDEVVTIVLAATKAASGDYGRRWNWAKEENGRHGLRNMCETWYKKHPEMRPAPAKAAQAKPAPKIVGGTDSAGATVHKLDDARKPKQPKTAAQVQAIIDKANIHVTIAAVLIKAWQDRGTPVLIIVDQLWRYSDGIWSAPESKGRQSIDAEIDACIRGMKQMPTIKLVSEVRACIFRDGQQVYRDEVQWDHHGKIAVRGGLIDPVTFAFEAAKPEHNVTARIDVEYDAIATCPVWLEMLDATFADRDNPERVKTIVLIQDVLGAALIEEKSKALSRALVFHGISNTGKTDLIKVISGLLTDNPITTPLSALEGAHGLMGFMRNAPWVLHEAFDSQKWHFSATVKSILSGDPVQINVKNGPMIDCRIRQPIFWGTNIPPQFKETTRAIINRMIVVSCLTVFDPKVPVGVALAARKAHYSEPSDLILATEKAGLLNWAMVGLRRAMDRGYFITTDTMDETLEGIAKDANFTTGFLEDCCTFLPNAMITTSDFCAALSVWWGETKGEDSRAPSNESIGRKLASKGDPRVGIDSKVLRTNKHNFYVGIHLNGVGLDYWSGAASEGLARGKTARLSAQQSDVNRFIPASWDELPVVVKIKKYHGAKVVPGVGAGAVATAADDDAIVAEGQKAEAERTRKTTKF
jgi:phage/plasmid-associated DNA primase